MRQTILQEMRRRRGRRWAMGTALALGTLLVLSLILEVGVRLLVPAAAFEPLANLYAVHNDPRIGYVLQPRIRRLAFGVPLRANRDGFRGPGWSPAPVPKTRRIALIGDSHAFGFGVAFDASLGEQLARRLDARAPGVQHEVLNFAIPGYNALQQRAVFENLALAYQPDAVVVVFCNNDGDPQLWCDAEGFLRRGEPGEDGPHARLLSWPERGWMRAKSGPLGASRLYLYLRLQWLRYRQKERHGRNATAWESVSDPLRPDPQAVAAATVDAGLRERVLVPLRAIGAECQKRNLPVVFACVTSGPAWLRILDELGEAAGAPTIALFSLFPEVSTYGELQRQYSLGWDSHLNAEVHRRWAEALAERLRFR